MVDLLFGQIQLSLQLPGSRITIIDINSFLRPIDVSHFGRLLSLFEV